MPNSAFYSHQTDGIYTFWPRAFSVSQELHTYLMKKASYEPHTAYNPVGNGQVEKYNGTV